MSEISKAYISDFIQDLELLFFNMEKSRLEKIKYPFYDGGLTPIVIYYTRKYKLPIKFPNFINEIKGNTLLEITSNFYTSTKERLNLEGKENDLFSIEYIKNYYFFNTYYDIKVVYNKIKGLYESKQLNQGGEFYWMSEIQNALLSFMAVNEKISLGVNDGNIKNFNQYFDFIKEITEEYLANFSNKSDEEYITNFWLYQLINPTSNAIKSEGVVLVNSLLKKRNKKKLWTVDYLTNWIYYGVIKDYLSLPTNLDIFLSKYSLKEVTKGLVYEGFTNKSKSKKNKTKKNKKSKKTNKTDKSKPKQEISWWKTGLVWVLLPLIVFLGIRLMMFFWSTIFSFISK
jgi:hypothetical protein